MSLSFGLSSCETSYAGINSSGQYEEDVYSTNREVLLNDVDINLIVTSGTPYYYDGYLNYYYYRGLYYYPIFYNNYWYFRPYYRPFRRGYFPSHRNWRPNPHWRGYNGFRRPDRHGRIYRRDYYRFNRYQSPNVRSKANDGHRDFSPRRDNVRFGNGNNMHTPRRSPNETMRRSNRPSGSFGTSRPSSSFGGMIGGSRDAPSTGHFGGHR